MLKKHKVAMLSTEKASNILLEKDSTLLYSTFLNEMLIQPSDKFQHLYILSDEEIKVGDQCYNSIKNTWDKDIILYQGCMPEYHFIGFKKIIASTDPTLGLPRPSNEFLEAYCKKGGIDEVMVEYEYTIGDKPLTHGNSHITPSLTLKTAPDNTITIKAVKNSWNKEEVIQLLRMAFFTNGGTKTEFDNWIGKNI